MPEPFGGRIAGIAIAGLNATFEVLAVLDGARSSGYGKMKEHSYERGL